MMQKIIFSEPEHIDKILNGTKRQTTRTPNRYKCGETVQLCSSSGIIGTAVITGIRKVGSDNTALFSEWMNDSLNSWAIDDGFENFKEADGWFKGVYGDHWKNREWDIIYF